MITKIKTSGGQPQVTAGKSVSKPASTASAVKPKPPAIAAAKVVVSIEKSSPDKTASPPKMDKPKKIKMVRDSFTMPETDYSQLAELKKKCLQSGIHVKKSELLRVGLLSLSKMSDSALLKAVAAVEKLKTGRPAKQ